LLWFNNEFKAILLLSNLSNSDPAIQSLIVFENIFDLIIKTIEDEGGLIDGGVVVNDCLELLFNILQTNNSNKMLFMEVKYSFKLCSYLNFNNLLIMDHSNNSWTKRNISILLKIVRCLLAPNPSDRSIVVFFQQEFNRFQLINRLFELYVLTGSSDYLLSEVRLKTHKLN
jgi:hypothetical protein